jgi:endonuclease/exonuclease/phosphatase family metal-dependent hydrolase
MRRLRIATYNVHKCRGIDTRMRPARVAEVIRHLDADVVALQEVVRGRKEADQLRAIQHDLPGYEACFGETRKIGTAGYGNAVLSRLPIAGHKHFDITASWREMRGALRADIRLGDSRVLHLFNVHLGTGYIERRRQGQMLVSEKVLNDPKMIGSRLVLGDFNEWTRGLCTRLLSAHLLGADLRPFYKRYRSYPGMLPFMHLDHIYYDPIVELRNFKVYRTRLSLMASDHLPLVADFEVKQAAADSVVKDTHAAQLR